MGDTPSRQPDVRGVLSKTPVAHLLVYAAEKRLTGSFSFFAQGTDEAVLRTVQGRLTKAWTRKPVALLGTVLEELGYVTQSALEATRATLAGEGGLHGQILLEQGIITGAQLREALSVQLDRKLLHIFALPPACQFAYYADLDLLEGYGGTELPDFDVLSTLWKGICLRPPWEHVDATLTRFVGKALQTHERVRLDRFRFDRDVADAACMLVTDPMPVDAFVRDSGLSVPTARLLIYCLIVTKQVVTIDASPSAASRREQDAMATPSGLELAVDPSQRGGFQARPSLSFQAVRPSMGAMPAVQPAAPARASSTSIPAVRPAAGTAPERATRPPDAPRPSVSMPAVRPSTSMAPVRPSTSMQAVSPSTASMRAVHPAIRQEDADETMTPVQMPQIRAARPSIPVDSGPTSALPSVPPPLGGGSVEAEQARRRGEILQFSRSVDRLNYFQMLGLPLDAGTEDVEAAFLRLAKVWHPDRQPSSLADLVPACTHIVARLNEAYRTLRDPSLRERYMPLVRQGNASPDGQAYLSRVQEAATHFRAAEQDMSRGDLVRAEQAARLAYERDPTQAEYLALFAWIESLKPQAQEPHVLQARISMLDRAIAMSDRCERAFYYRGMLYKRIGRIPQAISDLQSALSINPRALDAASELRLLTRRQEPTPAAPEAPQGRSISGLFKNLLKRD